MDKEKKEKLKQILDETDKELIKIIDDYDKKSDEIQDNLHKELDDLSYKRKEIGDYFLFLFATIMIILLIIGCYLAIRVGMVTNNTDRKPMSVTLTESTVDISDRDGLLVQHHSVVGSYKDLRRTQDISNKENELDMFNCVAYTVQLKYLKFEENKYNGKDVLEVEYEVTNMSDVDFTFDVLAHFKCISEVDGVIVENKMYSDNILDKINYSYPIKSRESNTFQAYYLLEDKYSPIRLYCAFGEEVEADSYIEIVRSDDKFALQTCDDC